MSGDNNKVYGAHKVSEYTHGKEGYRITETDEMAENKRKKDQFIQQLESDADLDYKKKHTLGKDQEKFKAEYKSTRDALKEFSPWQWRKQLEYVKGLTPEEYETVLRCVEELKANVKCYTFTFMALTVGFTYWQRIFLPRGFYPFALLMGGFAGVAYGSIKTGWYFVEKLDQLGKDYELSRMIKQDIFDTRPDLDSGSRAQYYMYQQRKNDGK